MKIAVIICEYNPLHNGHLRHLLATSAHGCDAVVCLMSGDLTQRGDVALTDKYTRAQWAVKCGADMVLEIDPRAVLGSSRAYAEGAISLASKIEGFAELSFGCECGDAEALARLAKAITSNNADFKADFKAASAAGLSYAASISAAVSRRDATLGALLAKPNNLLGAEYIAAMTRLGCKAGVFAIKRDGNHNDEAVDADSPSARALRVLIAHGEDVSDCVPEAVDVPRVDFARGDDVLLALTRYVFARTDASDIIGMREGINNRIKHACVSAPTYDGLLKSVKTKRYPLAYIKRQILAALSACRADEKPAEYVNVLAVSSASLQLLSLIDAPVVTRPSDFKRLSRGDALDLRVKNLFECVRSPYDAYMRIVPPQSHVNS